MEVLMVHDDSQETLLIEEECAALGHTKLHPDCKHTLKPPDDTAQQAQKFLLTIGIGKYTTHVLPPQEERSTASQLR